MLKKHLILLRSLEEAFSGNSVLFKTVPGDQAFRHFVKNSCSANYRCMTHDIYFVKTRTNKQKQTDVLLYVNDGCGLNNCYSIKCNKQQDEYLCLKGKDMYFRWRRRNRDRTRSDRTGSRIGSRKKSFEVS